jgi:hypothetical protein
VNPDEARVASASIKINSIITNAAVLTRVRVTFIDVGLTERTRVASNTSAGKAIDRIDAGGTVLTRIRRAFVDVGLTQVPFKTSWANTRKSIETWFVTSGAVLTRIGRAFDIV